MRELKVVPIDKLRRRLMLRRMVIGISLKAVALIILGILAALVIMMASEPYEAVAETLPAKPAGPIDMVYVTGAAETELETAAETEPQMEYIGTFTLTAYCNCRKCCGKWARGPTASGEMPEAGKTIAVDPDVIPLGTRVYIDGMGEYVAQDTGSAINGNRIDVYMDSHTAARNFADGAGSCKAEVYIVSE